MFFRARTSLLLRPSIGLIVLVLSIASIGTFTGRSVGVGRSQSAMPTTGLSSQVASKAAEQYSGDGLAVAPTSSGARLRSAFQKLNGDATRGGLWVTSTVAGENARLRLIADAVGRDDRTRRLARSGAVQVTKDQATFTRSGLTEQYATSVDGVRQDFIVDTRPSGSGQLHVDLALTGAAARSAAGGAELTLDGSGRVISYGRLRVVDAANRELPARLNVLSADRLAVVVDDANAVYPVRIDPTFSDANWVALNPGLPGVISRVDAIAIDGGGSIYVGGSFFTAAGAVAANRIAKWDGTAWSALGSGMNDRVVSLAIVGTDLYAGGWFTTAGGVSANRIAKWNGSAWSALGAGMNGSVLALAADGATLYAGGEFTTAGGGTANRIAKWNGTAWSSLGTGTNDSVNALAITGTTLYAAGNFLTAGGVPANLIAKWDTSGIGGWSALGAGLRNGSNGFLNKAWSIAVAGTDIYVGGDFDTAGGASANRIAKWNTGTSTWSTLGTGLSNTVYSVAVIGSTVYVAGAFQAAGSASANFVAQWNGSAWSALGPNGTGTDNTTQVLAVSGTDLYLGGAFNKVATISAKNIAKWSGSAWSSLGTGIGGQQVNAIAFGGGNLYIAGTFLGLGGQPYNQVLEWDGTSWSALGSAFNSNTVAALAVVGTDIYAGGSFTTAGSVTTKYVAKWNGTAWSALGTGMDNQVNSFAVIGTTLYAGGYFTTAGGVTVNRVAKWNGTAWSALGTGMDNTVRALLVVGGELYASGDFSTAGGASAIRIAKWNGTSWSALGAGLNNSVWALATNGTDLYAGGTFTTAGGAAANRVAKWSAGSWSALGSGIANSTVIALAAYGSDLYVGGDFSVSGGNVSTKSIAKWDGTSWSPLGSGTDGNVRALLADTSGHLFVGGNFGLAGTTSSAFIARADVGSSNTAPVANAGADQFAAATSASGASATLNASSSSDPEGDSLTYSWTNDFNGTVLTGAAPSITVPLGAHTFTLTVTDGGGLTSTDTVIVTVTDSFTISIATPPLVGASYFRNQVVPGEFTCSDTANLIASCTANIVNLDTATAGTKTFTVTATNTLGDTSSQSRTYDVVAQAAQAIVFPAPAAPTYGGTATLGAMATSGLSVAYTSTTPAVCSVSGSIVTTLAVGSCSITANQAGDANWLAAAPATQTFAVLTRPVTATLTANSKVYDGTTSESNAGLSCALAGVLAADASNVVCTPTNGAFDNPMAGSPRTVTAILTLTGSAAGNYTYGAAGTTNSSTTSTNAATSTTASVVFGQLGSFSAVAVNPTSADSLASPRGVAADANGNIYVADRDNNRVLFFPFGQTTATRVYGQGGSFTTNAPGLGAGSFTTVNRVTVDATGLYVSDAGNNRVLFFPGNSTTPTRVYGQGGSFTSNNLNASGPTADSLGSTRGIAVDAAGNVYIADAGNNRVLYYPAGSTTATRVYGQNGSLTTGLVNNTGGVAGVISESSLNQPNGLRLDTAGNLYVADQSNNRVLMFPAGQTTATVVYGQGGSFATGTANNGGVSASSFNVPSNLALDGGNNLYVAESNNNRVLFFPSGQTTATAVFGQGGSFAGNAGNNGGVSADSLRAPNSVDLDFAGNIYISDATNNRVLRYTGSAPAITPAALTVTALSGTKAYGATFTVTPSYTGFVNGETSAVLTSQPTCTSAGAAAGAAPGTYATTCNGVTADNYSISYVSGTMTVTTTPVTATLTASGKIYDGTTAEPDASMSCTLTGVLPADSSSVTCTATGGSFDGINAASHTVTATVTIGGTAAGHYTLGAAGTTVISATQTATATIAKANQSLSVAAGTSLGSPDTAFGAATGTGFNARTTSAAVQPDGKIVVGGLFTTFNGVAANFIARLNADGTRDTSFSTGGSGFDGQVNAVAVQADGKIVVGGQFSTLNGSPAKNIARLNADGTPDTTFTTNTGTGLDQAVLVVAVQPDGKILAGGYFFRQNGVFSKEIARFNADGTPDVAFRTNLAIAFDGEDVWRIALQPDGKIVVVGSFYALNLQSVHGVARINADGTPDVTFNANTGAGLGGGGQNLAVALQADGKILLGGTFSRLNNVLVNGIGRLNADGTPDTTFTELGGAPLNAVALAVQPDGKIVAGTNANSRWLVRVNPDGSKDTGFETNLGTGLNNAPESIVLQPDGAILMVDSFTTLNGQTANRIARLKSGSWTTSKTYGDAPFAASATASSGLAAVFASTTPGVCTVSGSTVTIVAAGTCAIAIDQSGDGNYNAAPQVVQYITVGAAPVTATLAAAGKVYDGAAAEPDASMSCALAGVLPADAGNVACTATSGTFNSAAVGSRTVTATVTISGAAAVNYTLGAAGTSTLSASKTSIASITAQALTATIAAANKTYDGTANATITSCTLAGVVGSDAVGCAASGTAANNQFSSATAGAGKPVTATGITLTGAAAGNYVLVSSTATTTADISQAAATIVVTSYAVTFDGQAHSATGVATGVASEDLSSLLHLALTAHTGAGDYPEDAWTFDGDANYAPATGFASDRITKATSTTVVTCTPSVTYTGAALEVCSASVTGVGGLTDTATVTYTNNINVGTAHANATYAGDENHDGSTASATFDITAKALAVTANDKTRTSSEPNPAFDGTLTGVVDGDGITATYSTTATAGSPVGTYPITPALLDPLGKLGNYSVTITPGTLTVTNEAPSIVVPADITAEATSASGATVTFIANGTDLEDGAIAPVCTPASGSTFPLGATTVTCTVTDSGGLSASTAFTVTIVDTTAPIVTVPPNATLDTAGPAGRTVTFATSSADLVDGTDPVTCAPASGSTFPIGSTTVMCSATDARHNTATASFIVLIVNAAPVANADGVSTPEHTPVTLNVLANDTDSDGGVLEVTAVTQSAHGSVTIGAAGNVTYTPASGFYGTDTFSYTLIDHEGGSATGTVTVTISRLGRFVAFSIDSTWIRDAATIVTGDVGANQRVDRRDNDDRHHVNMDDGDEDDVTVRIGTRVTMAQPGSRVVGDTVRLYDQATIHDLLDNFTVDPGRPATILGTVSHGMPVPFLGLPAFPSVTPGTATIAVRDRTTSTLTAGAYGRVHVGRGATLILSGGLYQFQQLDVDESATVMFHAAAEIRIKTNLDTDHGAKLILDPAVTGLRASDVIFYVAGQDKDSWRDHDRDDEDNDRNGDGRAIVHIGQSNVVQANIYAPSGTLWIMSRTVATGAFIGEDVRIGTKAQLTLDSAFGDFAEALPADTDAPAIESPRNIGRVEARAHGGAVITFRTPDAWDSRDGSVPVTCSPASGGTFPVGHTTVTCSASDTSGNQASTNFDVWVVDTQAPDVTLPRDFSVTTTSSAGAIVTYDVTSTDMVDGVDPITCTRPSGGTFPVGTTTVICSATDAAGNTGSDSVRVTVKLLHPPIARADSYRVGRSGTLKVNGHGVLANDDDPDGCSLTAALVAGPSHGTLALDADGSFVYTAAANYRGSDTFTYRAVDDAGLASAIVTVTLTIG